MGAGSVYGSWRSAEEAEGPQCVFWMAWLVQGWEWQVRRLGSVLGWVGKPAVRFRVLDIINGPKAVVSRFFSLPIPVTHAL